MGKYHIMVEECHISTLLVTAKDETAATQLALHGGGTPIQAQQMLVRSIHGVTVMPSPGRPAKAATKRVATKRKPMSPEARAKLAQNLVKARAARAAKRTRAKKAARRKTTA